MRVKVSIIWLNYNSAKFINLALSSLKSLFELSNDDYEVIVVDNASSDNSFETIRNFIECSKLSKIRVKVVRSDMNRGYSGGINLGWMARNPESKYVVFLNKDLIVDFDSLRKIIEYMQGEANVGAASGLIYYGDGRTIYSAGGIFTELWNAGGICWNNLGYECYGKDKPHYVTYADGAYTVVDAEIVRSISINGKPFFDKAFLYFDDYILGLLLWNKGYKVRYYPIEAGFHYAHKTIKPVIDYFGIRAHIALMSVVKTRFKPMASIHVLRRSAIHSVLCAKGVQKSCDVIRAIYDGILLGNYAKNRIGVLTLYKAPYFRRKFEELKCFVTGLCKESKITFKDITYPLNGV